jgi:hypothetical protein
MGKTDCYRFGADGMTPLRPDLRKYMFSILNYKALDSIFVFKTNRTKEVWFCIPTVLNGHASTRPNRAFIYNEELDNWSIYDCTHITAYGNYARAGEASLDIIGTPFGDIYKLDDTDNTGSLPINAWIQSGAICVQDGETMLDGINKFINSITPQLTATTVQSGMLYIQVGTKKRLSDDYQWTKPFEYKIGTSVKAHFRVQGKWFAVKFRTYQKNSPFGLGGYQIDYTLGGSR